MDEKFLAMDFKFNASEDEVVYNPEIIEHAFVDVGNILKLIHEPSKFIIIGAKGSGKTSLAVKLERDSSYHTFAVRNSLYDYEYNLLKKIGGSSKHNVGTIITAWELLFILSILPILKKDQKFVYENPEYSRTIREMEKYGIVQSPAITSITRNIARRGVFAELKKAIFLGYEATNQSEMRIKDTAALLDALKKLLSEYKYNNNRYYLILDNVDYILKKGVKYTEYIYDLIEATRSINVFFTNLRSNIKVILLLRTEILDRIHGPNSAKALHNNSIILNWYQDTNNPFNNDLFKVIEKRAYLVGYTEDIKSLWQYWFPKTIDRSTSYKYILKHTRLLPRDLVVMFSSLQSAYINSNRSSTQSPLLNRPIILNALRLYSDNFSTEIFDSIAGLVRKSIRGEIAAILERLGKEFSYNYIEAIVQEYDPKCSPRNFARILYDVSCIGHKWHDPKSKKNRYTFKYRKRFSRFDERKKIIIHPGLWKALNMI